MTVQTIKLGREDYVILRKRDYERLRKSASEDAQDTATIRRRLAGLKQRGEKSAVLVVDIAHRREAYRGK